jgi:phosphoribosyl 1,2-cyclic phosphate phosphodiesterase
LNQTLTITFLGTGTSQGVPVIACSCEVCSSLDDRDKRLRSSVLVEVGGKVLVIDTGPDFRQQLLRDDVQQLDAILFTHEHKDHIAGLDDVRAFNYKFQKPMEVYCTEQVAFALKREFHYVFSEEKYPGIPSINLNVIDNKSFEIEDIQVLPVEVLHYKLPVFGFRIADFVYITDAKTISTVERDKVRGCKVLVINALHKSKHISHFNLEEALEFIADVKPERAYLTHISHLFGKHAQIELELPDHVFVAYDGLKLTLS